SARTRLEAAARRGLTRFVGRSAELEQLRDTLDQASQGRGQVVSVVGEPGVGKSRLFWEFTHSHRLQGWLVLESPSVSYGNATRYLPVIDLLKRARGAIVAPRQLSLGIQPWLGRQDLLPPAAHRSAAPRECRGAAGCTPRPRCGPRFAQAA